MHTSAPGHCPVLMQFGMPFPKQQHEGIAHVPAGHPLWALVLHGPPLFGPAMHCSGQAVIGRDGVRGGVGGGHGFAGVGNPVLYAGAQTKCGALAMVIVPCPNWSATPIVFSCPAAHLTL